MYFVQCKEGCGTYIPTAAGKSVLRWCGVRQCAARAWVEHAEAQGVRDFFE